jgi:hypothetical protein
MSHMEDRVFSFRDVLSIMDRAGVGMGSTIHIIQEIDRDLDKDNSTGRRIYRRWDFEKIPATIRVLADALERRRAIFWTGKTLVEFDDDYIPAGQVTMVWDESDYEVFQKFAKGREENNG